MAGGNTIEAKLRIAAEVAQAITALQQVRKELVDTGKAAGAAGKGSGRGAGKVAADETNEVTRELKKRSQAEREAANAKKQQDKEEADRRRAAAREAKRLADEEERQRRKKERDEERRRQLEEAARRRAERQATYNKAALAPQLNDVFVGLTTGQSPLQVALQQGPQITQIYGGVAKTFQAVTAAITPMRVAIGLAAVGFGTLAVQIAAGYRESSQLNKELALSGNIAGTSLGQINSLASSISAATGQSIGFVRDALREVLQLSGQTDTTLASTTRAATALAKLNGASAGEAVKAFENQADGITQWSVKANRAYNFLTAGQVAYIRSLEQQGRIAEATRFVNEQLADTLQQRGVGAIGLIERGWNAAGRAVSFFLDQLKKVGRDETTEERLASLAQQLKTVEDRIALRERGLLRDGTSGARDQAERERLQGLIQATNREALRRSENAAALREEQERIKREGKEFQQILAGQRAADAQRSLAQREAQLDAEQALVQRAHAQELISEAQQAQQLNAIDQRRAQAQLALAERLLQIERDRTPSLESKNEVEAQKAQLTQLEAQVIAARSRVAEAVGAGQRVIDAEISRLNEAIRRTQNENLRTMAGRERDPAERARLEAEAATAEARREFEKIERDIQSRMRTSAGLAGSEGIRARLQQQLNEASQALDELTRRAKLDSVSQQLSEAQQALATREAEIQQLVQQGAITTEQAEERKYEARDRAIPQLEQLLVLQRALATTDAERTSVDQTLLALQQLKDRTTEVESSMRSAGQTALTDFLNGITTGAKTGKEALVDLVVSFGRALQNLINQRLAEKLFKQFEALGSNNGGDGWWGQLLKALFNSGSGRSNIPAGSTAAPASVYHQGGVIGRTATAMRMVSPLVFAGAQVLHSGGLVTEGQRGMALRPNERAVIAEVGEEMLTEDSPRHIKNYRGNGVQVSMSITVNGATGSEQQQVAELEQLQRMVAVQIEQWAADQRRQGGMLAGVRRG